MICIVMLIHYKNNANHCKINDMCIVVMLIHDNNNANHCKINDLCIAVMLIHCTNNANHCKINEMCIAVMRSHYKNNTNHCKCNDLCYCRGATSFCGHGRGRVAPAESESVKMLSSPIHIGLDINRSCRTGHDGTGPKQ